MLEETPAGEKKRKFNNLNLVGLVLTPDFYICIRSDWQWIALTALVERRCTMQVLAALLLKSSSVHFETFTMQTEWTGVVHRGRVNLKQVQNVILCDTL